MKIGVDIDDVISNTSQIAANHIKRQKLDISNTEMQNLMRGEPTTPLTKKFLADNNLEIIKNVKLLPNTREAIDKLRQQGHQIIIITRRGDDITEGLERVTRSFLNENHIKFDEIYFGIKDKLSLAKQLRLDVMIDDSPQIIKTLSRGGVGVILFSSAVNQNVNLNGVVRANGWNEVEQIINSKNP
jgi:uncharacterized HAD superfamily protein